MNNRAKVFLKPNEEKEILQGFPWVFDNEILSVKNHDEKNLEKAVSYGISREYAEAFVSEAVQN